MGPRALGLTTVLVIGGSGTDEGLTLASKPQIHFYCTCSIEH